MSQRLRSRKNDLQAFSVWRLSPQREGIDFTRLLLPANEARPVPNAELLGRLDARLWSAKAEPALWEEFVWVDSSTLYGLVSGANMSIRSSTGSGRGWSLTAKVVANCSLGCNFAEWLRKDHSDLFNATILWVFNLYSTGCRHFTSFTIISSISMRFSSQRSNGFALKFWIVWWFRISVQIFQGSWGISILES